MSDAVKNDLQQKLQALYVDLEKANIALFSSKSVENELVVRALEDQVNELIDTLIEMDAEPLES
ncbi:hypothetical protein B9Z35_08925 [Limnohabitans sp. Jir61]|uniref:hypothetical protein n=1 Tax=Limnohabitans sp. Jir61 TaxID=1826168 RepID=UPI000D3836D4|nr:hypothetical protein [Limnohabitans sp. Jir61]PUE31138.1 hypothetical protein B9Z35_08925 [Limnohabitans sp. Jir61]